MLAIQYHADPAWSLHPEVGAALPEAPAPVLDGHQQVPAGVRKVIRMGGVEIHAPAPQTTVRGALRAAGPARQAAGPVAGPAQGQTAQAVGHHCPAVAGLGDSAGEAWLLLQAPQHCPGRGSSCITGS